ncbi:MAG: bifunctional homocysteine S-methyltransferase/methylenetetrahydrofolate reductase [Chloroflexi bacterium]|nr:bifunctional homocysteine S-methyltransferase/methylenetetrahydrofolate reductase [Chloroflexota bacterium]
MRSPFLDRLERGPVLSDGAMGTQLYARGIPYERCFDELNLTDPALIQRIHRDYIRAGAELIETNTYGANRYKLAQYGLEDRVRDINFRAVKLAREAREECGEPVFLAGAMGPLGLPISHGGTLLPDDVGEAFRDQADALLEAGADLIVLETFSDLVELREAIVAVQSACDLPIVAQVSLTDDGLLLTGEAPADVARLLASFQVDVIGVNCGVGPQSTLDAVQQMALPLFAHLSAMPNAGAPSRLEGRYMYFSTPEYFAEYARRFASAGVRLIGGCCGTTPAHVSAMREALAERDESAPTTIAFSAAPDPQSEAIESAVSVEPTALQRALTERKFVVSVELDPPKGLNPTRIVNGAAMLADVGVDCINIGDSPMARVRMGCVSLALHIQRRVGLDTIIHFTTRDRNLMALQSELLGAHSHGIRNILALTGDPPRMGNLPQAKAVWDVDSIGLIAILKRMNEGQDWAGNSIGMQAQFFVGCAVNPVADDIELELDRFHRKIEAGADYVMAQPLYDMDQLMTFLNRVGKIPVPFLLGVMPLQSHKHAEFLHNELPGVTIPDHLRERMRLAGDQGMQEGIRQSQEFLVEAQAYCDGAYLMPSFGRYEMVAELVKVLDRDRWSAERAADAPASEPGRLLSR